MWVGVRIAGGRSDLAFTSVESGGGSLPSAMKTALSTPSVVEKAQHEPHPPWFWAGNQHCGNSVRALYVSGMSSDFCDTRLPRRPLFPS